MTLLIKVSVQYHSIHVYIYTVYRRVIVVSWCYLVCKEDHIYYIIKMTELKLRVLRHDIHRGWNQKIIIQ